MNAGGPVREAYFYLSHARPPSMAVDHWVQVFYGDLLEAVRSLAGRNVELEIGHCDLLPPGQEREVQIDHAVSSARVLVPLYTPEYLDTPPPDRGKFRKGKILPVLWAPLPPGRSVPDLAAALDLSRDLAEPAQREYALHGLSALCRLSAHSDTYQAIVQRLAERIVEAAELPASITAVSPQLNDIVVPGQSEISFIVAVIAPSENRIPPRRQTTCYGPRATGWRPFRNGQELPIAEYTARVAANLMMPTRIVDFAANDNRLDTSPGVILVDPWVLAHNDGRRMLRAAFDALRQWVTLVVVVDRNDAQYETASAYADEVTRMTAGSGGHKVVRDVHEFEQQIGRLIVRTRRHYLNRPPTPGPAPSSAPEEDLR